MPPVQSGAPAVNAKKVTQFGLGAAQMTATGTTNRFARDTSFDNYTANGAGPVSRGFVKVEASPIPGGCRIKLNTFHGQYNDSLNVYLLAEVLDKKTNQLRTVTLSVLAQGANFNGSTYRGEQYFDLDYNDINAFLKSKNSSLQITPGTTELAIAAQWAIGHQAGGFGRGGNFRLPMPQGQTQNVVSVRTNAAVGQSNADLPLDMQVAYPAALEQQLPKLKRGGNVVSRLESELKGSSSKQEMLAAIKEAYRLAALAHAGKDSQVEAVLGADWTIEPVSRYWLKDDGKTTAGSPGTGMFKGYRVDQDGFPMQDPMTDRYMDDGQLGMTRLEGAIRLRSNSAATGVNVKPGGGRRDQKTQITQRIEVGIELEPNATAQDAAQVMTSLASGQWSGTIFNHAQKQVKKLDPNLQLSQALQPWADIIQERHKFTVKNKVTGVEVELSLDKVHAKTLRPQHANADGTAREADFYVLEAELDHLQLQSTNQGTYVAGTSVQQGAFTTDAQQDTWLKSTSQDVTMDIEPRLHEITDLDNDSFRQTTSYKAFEGLSKKLLPALFPNGLGDGRQKAAHAAELMGLVNFDPAKLKASLQRFAEAAGFEWNQKIDQAADAAIADPAKRKAIDIGLSQSGAAAIQQLVESQLGSYLLVYDLPKLKQRIVARLESLGYASTPAIDQMLDKLTATNLPPQSLEATLVQMQSYDDTNVLVAFARAVGVSPVPAPTKAPKGLFTQARQDALQQKLEAMGADAAQAKDILAFFEQAIAAGESVQQTRAQLDAFSHYTPSQIDQIAARYPALAAQKPVLRASPTGLATRAEPYMKQQFVALDADAREVLKKIAETRPMAQALQFPQTLGVQAGQVLAREAKALGVAYTPSYDWPAFEASFQPFATSAMIVLDAPLKQFLRDCFAAGVPANILQTALQRASATDFASALRQSNIFIVGPQIPSVAYDAAGLKATVTTRLGAQAAALKKTWVDSTIDTLLKAGATPTQIQNFLIYTLSQGTAQAGVTAGIAHLTQTLPPVELDDVGIATYLQQRFGAQWTAAHDQFAKQALATLKPGANVGPIFSYYYPQQVTQHLRTLSGLTSPPGI